MLRYEHGGDIYGEQKVLLDFSVNTNPLGMPPQVAQALQEGVAEFCRYPDTQCRALRHSLGAHYGLATENILCGAGAADMIFRICACLRPRRALVLAPTFSEYERPVKLFGGEVVEYALSEENGFHLTEELLNGIPRGVDMLFLCNPNNPTGQLAPEGLLPKLLKLCEARGIMLVVDECFLDFTRGESMAKYLPESDKLLILRAFTKLYSLAGLRLGYLLGQRELLERIALYAPEWAVSVPAQLAGVAALSAEPQWTAATRAFVDGQRERMAQRLTALGLRVYDSDTNFLLLQAPVGLAPALRERGLLIRSCANFSGLGEGFVRVAVKRAEENDVLLKAIEEEIHG